jgi:hypothetical protein
LAAGSISRFAGVSTFDERVSKDALASFIRQVQQDALVGSNVNLTIETNNPNVVFKKIASGSTIATRIFPINEVGITAGSVGSGTTCGSISSTITLNFDSAGEIETVDDDGFPICLNGQSSLCISPAGFAHQGACL